MGVGEIVREKLKNGGVEVHVIVGLYEGCLHEVRATLSEKRGDEIEREMCEDLDLDYEHRWDDEYRKNDVYHQIVKLE